MGAKLPSDANGLYVEAMREKELDLAGERPQKLTSELAARAQLLVTMAAAATSDDGSYSR